ncbi:MAG: ATP-dependent helicase [Deltaproteobacteria bacterium]|nr:ATP-dependent helicase [Deltaproteobacteria bacterium]
MSEPIPTQEQSLVIDYSGNLVAIAKPGSGKTFVLAQKIQGILGEMPEYRGVIAISYTNKASAELAQRATRGIVKARASFFGTVDSFCVKEIVLPFLAHLWGKPASEVTISRLRDLPPSEAAGFGDLQDGHFSAEYISTHVTSFQSQFLGGRVFLETLGALAYFTLKHSNACRSYLSARYSHVFIDEYQDSGYEQHALFLELQSIGLTAVAVGDVDQAIFGFSHKDPKFLLELAHRSDFRTFQITQNHRCHASLVNYSTRIIASQGEIVPALDTRVFFKACAGTAAAIAQWIESVLSRVMADYQVSRASDIGILVFGNVSGQLVDGAMQRKRRLVQTHPIEEHFSLWAGLFAQLLSYRYDQKQTAQAIVDRTARGLNTGESRSALAQIKALRTVADEELMVRMEEIAMLLLPNAAKDAALALLKASKIGDLVRAFRPAADDEVQIMSLHKSKGLEFDVVFHLDLYEWLLPKKQPGPGNDFDNPIFPSLQQDLNLHYVGVTRARKACFLCTSTRRIKSDGDEKKGSPSEFLNINGLPQLRVPSPY